MGEFEGFDDGVAQVSSSGDPPLLALGGELDEAVSPGVAGALEQAAAGHPEIHVTMAGLSYCDLAGLRTIVRLTQDRGGGAETGCRQVVLYDVPTQIRAVLRILGWDTLPGLTFGGRHPATAAQAASPAQLQASAAHPAGNFSYPARTARHARSDSAARTVPSPTTVRTSAPGG
jgi:ABC-type transporter Mla MlaB component